jgi:protoporphyrin/coproporphyrin ferrochelatase
MPRFQPEPPFQHGTAPKTAVLLVNLGTPDAPTAASVRSYLAEFLSDPRIVEIPKPIWWLILHGIILRVRPAKSAAKYASIWMDKNVDVKSSRGSPLRYWTQQQAIGLQASLDAVLSEKTNSHAASQSISSDVVVRYAMRYGNPSIAQELDQLKAEGATRILILPLYPQYSGTTTASVSDAVFDWGKRQRVIPELRFVNRYHDHAGYIQMLGNNVREAWKKMGQPQVLVMTFHGVPERTLHLGDMYHCECFKTARLLAENLGLTKEQYRVTFQSRFGKAKWLQPYTEPTLIALAKAGIERVDVICPGFTSDCLETLEEIDMEAREAFIHAGGKQFNYIACPNDKLEWMGVLRDIATQHLQGWLGDVQSSAVDLQQSRARALTVGATN